MGQPLSLGLPLGANLSVMLSYLHHTTLELQGIVELVDSGIVRTHNVIIQQQKYKKNCRNKVSRIRRSPNSQISLLVWLLLSCDGLLQIAWICHCI